ncbi:hypothetical protein EW146_g4928 [Bondarzewia mesenterica]|uniref:Uncharacterized protein n=1 Tax=Bondarzewia mesenterica TaxID=1095465 RepID=A0A4S4LT28_9AGAM|nr:hypothetical protein EW146_g4928 [Bondarzewia mesenterica]
MLEASMKYRDILTLPHDFDVTDEASIRAHHDKLQSLRNAALQNPLERGHRFVVRLHRPPSDGLRPGIRRLPSFALSSDPCILVLKTRLQTDVDHWFQVWIAHISSPDAGEFQDLERVVVKFSQPSMWPIPDPKDIWWKYDYESHRVAALKEDFFYGMLGPIQGAAVPYNYGIHEVVMPNGENAYMLVTEYVDGITAAQWRQSIAHNNYDGSSSLNPAEQAAMMPLLQNLLAMILESIDAIHNLNVLHGDICSENIIIHPSAASPTQIVFINFSHGNISFTPQDAAHEGEIDATFEREIAATLFPCCLEHLRAIKEWSKEGLPRGLVAPAWHVDKPINVGYSGLSLSGSPYNVRRLGWHPTGTSYRTWDDLPVGVHERADLVICNLGPSLETAKRMSKRTSRLKVKAALSHVLEILDKRLEHLDTLCLQLASEEMAGTVFLFGGCYECKSFSIGKDFTNLANIFKFFIVLQEEACTRAGFGYLSFCATSRVRRKYGSWSIAQGTRLGTLDASPKMRGNELEKDAVQLESRRSGSSRCYCGRPRQGTNK